MDWEVYSFVIRGKIRKTVFLALYRPKTPSEISREIKVSTTHVSRSIKELEELNLVNCMTPKLKLGRVYKLTKKGEVILKKMQNT